MLNLRETVGVGRARRQGAVGSGDRGDQREKPEPEPAREGVVQRAAVERLRLLLQARRSGMSIAEIRTLASAFDGGSLTADLRLTLLREKLAGLDRQARALDTARATIPAQPAD